MRLVLVTAVMFCVLLSPTRAEDWAQWRGPRGDGTVIEKQIPLRWGTNQNVKWKAPLPGVGHASPIVFADRLFLVWAGDETQTRHLMALDRRDGKTLWDQIVLTSPMEHKNKLNSFASSTPATDGKLVYVSFLDQKQMYVAAYDYQGKRVWESRPGVFSSTHGFCSSPVIWKDTIIINGDHDGPGFLVALDRATGSVKWKIDRPNNTRSYCAPIVGRFAGRDQLVMAGSKCVAAYNPDTGANLWTIDGPTDQFVASLVFNPQANLFFLTAGFPERHMMGIKPDGAGNITATHVAWRTREDTSYVPSPVAVDHYFLVVSDKGIASCFEAASGKRLWKEKIGRGHSASLITANGLVYFLAEDGVMNVVKPGEKLQIVAKNDLSPEYKDEKYIQGAMFSASPAVSNGQMFIRSQRHLWCIQEKIGG